MAGSHQEPRGGPAALLHQAGQSKAWRACSAPLRDRAGGHAQQLQRSTHLTRIRSRSPESFESLRTEKRVSRFADPSHLQKRSVRTRSPRLSPEGQPSRALRFPRSLSRALRAIALAALFNCSVGPEPLERAAAHPAAPLWPHGAHAVRKRLAPRVSAQTRKSHGSGATCDMTSQY